MRIILDPVKLRAAIASAGLTQGQLAKLSGIKRPNISRWCKSGPYDDQLDVRLSTLAKLISHLKLNSIEPLLRYLPDLEEDIKTETQAATAPL